MRASAQTQMIAWTFTAVLLTGAGVLASLLSPPPSIALAQHTAAKPETRIQADRAPASYSGVDIDDKGTQAVDLSLPCEDRGTFSHNIAQIRFSGSLCGKFSKQEIASSEISNVTNGFSATVFPGRKSNRFTTDYITLANGENRIRIQHILKSGSRVDREFLIERD